MSRLVSALMLGIGEPVDVLLRSDDSDDDEPEEGLLDAFEASCFADIAAEAARLSRAGAHYARDDARKAVLPASTYESATRLLGYYVAVGVEDGDRGLGTVSLAKLETTEPYASRIAAARARWLRFSQFAEGRGIRLAEPELFLTVSSR